MGASVKRPVDSITTSTPSSPTAARGVALARVPSACAVHLDLPLDLPPHPGGTRIESYRSSCASVRASVRSLTATHSMSPRQPRLAARNTLRPMRPNPLIPTRTGIFSSPVLFRERTNEVDVLRQNVRGRDRRSLTPTTGLHPKAIGRRHRGQGRRRQSPLGRPAAQDPQRELATISTRRPSGSRSIGGVVERPYCGRGPGAPSPRPPARGRP